MKTIGMCDKKVTAEILKEIRGIIQDITIDGNGSSDSYIYHGEAEDTAIKIMKALEKRGCFS